MSCKFNLCQNLPCQNLSFILCSLELSLVAPVFWPKQYTFLCQNYDAMLAFSVAGLQMVNDGFTAVFPDNVPLCVSTYIYNVSEAVR